jgi:hypothetical protein
MAKRPMELPKSRASPGVTYARRRLTKLQIEASQPAALFHAKKRALMTGELFTGHPPTGVFATALREFGAKFAGPSPEGLTDSAHTLIVDDPNEAGWKAYAVTERRRRPASHHSAAEEPPALSARLVPEPCAITAANRRTPNAPVVTLGWGYSINVSATANHPIAAAAQTSRAGHSLRSPIARRATRRPSRPKST